VPEEPIEFHNHGETLRGIIHWPDEDIPRPAPLILAVPGWLEVRCSRVSEPFHLRLASQGYPVLAFDFRGCGASSGRTGVIDPSAQLDDLFAAIAFAQSRGDVDSNRIGLFSLGGTGGGLAISAAAETKSVRAVVVQTVVADTKVWLRSMRREHEWVAFLAEVERNRIARVTGGTDRLVDPTEEIMVATPERRQAAMPTRGQEYRFSSAEALLCFRPLDVVDRVEAALLICCIENDVVTPEEHAIALYERARGAKKLLRQRGVTHYEAYEKNLDLLVEHFVAWFDQYLVDAAIEEYVQGETVPPFYHSVINI
jgi:alpha-beta hydrolase superfamily lysophospholipase